MNMMIMNFLNEKNSNPTVWRHQLDTNVDTSVNNDSNDLRENKTSFVVGVQRPLIDIVTLA